MTPGPSPGAPPSSEVLLEVRDLSHLSYPNCLSGRCEPFYASVSCPCEHGALPAGSCTCHPKPLLASCPASGARGALSACSDLRSYRLDPVPGCGLCFGCGGGHDARLFGRGRRHCPRGNRSMLLGPHHLRPVHDPCSDGRVALPASFHPQSRSVVDSHACLELVSFCCDPARCGHLWAPGSCIRAVRPRFFNWNGWDSLKPVAYSDSIVVLGS